MLSKHLKVWSAPAVTSVERMKNAAGGNGNGLAKGANPAEFDFDGPGS